MTTDIEALDEIFDTFLSYWNDGIGSILSYSPQIYWPKNELQTDPDTTKHWLRVSNNIFDQRQTTLQTPKCYTTIGFIVIEFYFSKATLVSGDDKKMAVLARDAFRNPSSSNVWYRNSRIVEVDPEEIWYRNNVISDYTYYETV